MKIVTVQQMKEIEQQADAAGLSYRKMMLNAGLGIAKWVYGRYPPPRSVVGLVGAGNNGGDAIVALTDLEKRGFRTVAFLIKSRSKDFIVDNYLYSGGTLIDISNRNNFEVLNAFLAHDCIVLDGIVGTGFKPPFKDELHETLGIINNLLERRPNSLVIAVDCPSGANCDTGEISQGIIPASHTLVIAAIKQGLLKLPARSFAGEFHRVDIGIDFTNCSLHKVPQMLERALVKPLLPKRIAGAHKGTFGTCLILAGSQPYVGAAYLAGKAAYRAGCGLVDIGTTNQVYESLAGQLIEAIWTIIEEGDNQDNSWLKTKLQKVDSMVIGPGWGVNQEKLGQLETILKMLPKNLPTLFDADAIKLLSKISCWWEKTPHNTILTPHPGEMSILSGVDVQEIHGHRWEVALAYAQKWKVTLVLKGAMTVIAEPDGKLFVSEVSDTALATAGSGDVLSGVVGGLMAQGLTPTSAGLLGVWVQGRAGVIAKEKLGTDISVTAIDILNNLSCAFVDVKEAGSITSLE